MLKENLLLFSLNLLGGLVSAAPTYIGGPPPDIYGANPARAGPIDQGNTTFPAGTREGVGVRVIWFFTSLTPSVSSFLDRSRSSKPHGCRVDGSRLLQTGS